MKIKLNDVVKVALGYHATTYENGKVIRCGTSNYSGEKHQMDTEAPHIIIGIKPTGIYPDTPGARINDVAIVNKETGRVYFIANQECSHIDRLAPYNDKRSEAKAKLEEIEKTARELREEFNL